MKLLHSNRALVQTPIHSRSHSERSTDDGTDAGQEAREGLGAGLPVNDLHRGDIVVEEHAGDAALGVQTLLVALGRVRAAHERPLVRGDRVLVGLDAALGALGDAVGAERGGVVDVVDERRDERVPAQREVGGRDDLDEVHEVVRLVIGDLLGAVKRVCVVVRPLPAGGELVRQLRPEAQLVDEVRHGVFLAVRQVAVDVGLEVVRVHVARGEAAARRNMEVAHNLVHSENAFQPAAFPALRVNPLRVVFALALLDVLAASERPLFLRVRLAHFVAGVAAARFDDVGGRGCAAALAAVSGVEVLCFVAGVAGCNGLVPTDDELAWRGSLQVQRLDVQDTAALRGRAQPHFIHTVRNAHLLFAGDVHDIEGQEFAWEPGESHVEVNLHSLA